MIAYLAVTMLVLIGLQRVLVVGSQLARRALARMGRALAHLDENREEYARTTISPIVTVRRVSPYASIGGSK